MNWIQLDRITKNQKLVCLTLFALFCATMSFGQSLNIPSKKAGFSQLNWIKTTQPTTVFLNKNFHLILPSKEVLQQLLIAEKNLNKTEVSLKNVELFAVLGSYYESISDYEKSLYYLHEAKKLNNHQSVEWDIFIQNYIGYVYWHKSQYDSALHYHNSAFETIKKTGISSSNAAFNSLMLGNDYYDLGDYIKTSEYYFESLASFEKLQDTIGQVMALNRLSKLYSKLNDNESSHLYVKRALILNAHCNHLREMGNSTNCLGNIYIEKGKLDSALYYFTMTFEHFNNCGDIIGQSIGCINLGDTYYGLAKKENAPLFLLDSSYYYYEKSFILNKLVDNKFGMIYGIWGMADTEFKQNDFDNALLNYKNALQLSLSINAKSEEYNLYWKLFTVFEAKNIVDSSYYYLKKFVEVKHSLENEEQTKELLRQESKYEIEKRISEQKAEMDKEKLIEAEKNKWKNYLIIGIIIVAIALLYLVLNAIRKLKIIAQKNQLINTINNELSQQNREILDSITYAQRIQNAILPSERIIKEQLPDSFVLYLPKDIVAGDFYWLETTTPNEVVYLAAADCTGHGVPGAMVSVVCNNGLNRSVREYGILEPGKILDKTREIVIQEFEKSDEIVQDGMDIALISLCKKTLELKFAGANNPLWIITTNEQNEVELKETKPDNQPVGKYDTTIPFKTNVLQLKKNDLIYIFTDGYQDQFGGAKGKKFKTAALKNLFLSIHSLSMDKQQNEILKTFNEWKGSTDQIDDVCIIGIRV
jgi:serine phosphatase RsbU (regulator of sigma subunit)